MDSKKFCAVLTLILITLKFTGQITMSWIWVFAPLWIPSSILVAVLLVILVGSGLEVLLRKS
jgi:hypothetical protein